MSDAVSRPSSSVPSLTGYLGIIIIIFLFVLWPSDLLNLGFVEEAALFLLTVFICLASYELIFAKTYRAPETGLNFSQDVNLKEKFGKIFWVKIFGLLVSLALVSCYFWIADIYHDDWYGKFFDFIFDYFWVIASIVLAYFVLVHAYMTDPDDSYWHLGMFVLTRGQVGDGHLIRDHLLGLGIKAFFLPLMFAYFVGDWDYLQNFDWDSAHNFQDYYGFLYRSLFFIDLAFVVIGYVFTLRLFNSHIRWAERTIGGWFFCLLCYMPFWQLFGREYLNYFDGGAHWDVWLADNFILYVIWGSFILFLSALYVLSEAHFGLRFSNLTYRGLVSHGLFRFTKHPAYISKNLSWWMIDIPFVAVDWTMALRNSLTLLVLNFVYYMRAQYEERCLSGAPEYQDYSAYIKEKGWFSTFNINALVDAIKKY